MPTYRNGEVPAELLVTFERGENSRDGKWTHSLPPATYARHLALQKRARDRTGRHLRPGPGWTCYRPLWAQQMLKDWYTARGQANMSAWPGTSSHGLFWEGKQCAAIDYGNWDEVYAGFGGRAVFYDDCRAVGLTPGLIHPSRNKTYPDEPWHVVDLNTWGAVPAFDGVFTPFEPEEDMTPDQSAKLDQVTTQVAAMLDAISNKEIGILAAVNRAADHSAEADRELDEVRLKIDNAANISSDVRNLITDPNVGVLQAIRGIQSGSRDVVALADQLKGTLGADLAADLAKRLAE